MLKENITDGFLAVVWSTEIASFVFPGWSFLPQRETPEVMGRS